MHICHKPNTETLPSLAFITPANKEPIITLKCKNSLFTDCFSYNCSYISTIVTLEKQFFFPNKGDLTAIYITLPSNQSNSSQCPIMMVVKRDCALKIAVQFEELNVAHEYIKLSGVYYIFHIQIFNDFCAVSSSTK